MVPELGTEEEEEEESSSLSQEMQFLELGLEEAFFLTSELKCICIYQQQTSEGCAILSEEEVWRIMKNSKPQFVHLYKAYAHLRSKHWVVRAGLQFGADFMAYRHHPALVHSDYAVVVMWEMHEQRLNTWAEMQAMSRLCGSVAKTLLLLHISPNRETVDDSSPLCIHDFSVKVMEVRRWFPEKNREEHCQGMSEASRGEQKTKVRQWFPEQNSEVRQWFPEQNSEVRQWFPEQNSEVHCQGISEAAREEQKTSGSCNISPKIVSSEIG
ncbi:hypothetical protein CY35_18G031400 [Sphagnum magellanicum]|nr:hypothetical protein CY35_18G031400 [Sphagnum magellanicum]